MRHLPVVHMAPYSNLKTPAFVVGSCHRACEPEGPLTREFSTLRGCA